MARYIIFKCYKSDQGILYRVRVESNPYIGGLGFYPDDATKARLPSRLKMRYAIAYGTNADPFHTPVKRFHKVYIGDPAAEAWTTRPWFVDLPQGDGTIGGYALRSYFGERFLKQ